jgi:hypothetical protein
MCEKSSNDKSEGQGITGSMQGVNAIEDVRTRVQAAEHDEHKSDSTSMTLQNV